MQIAGGQTLVRYVQREFHLTVTRATEDGALTNKVARLIRGERQLGGRTFVNLHIQVELAETETVCDVGALDHEDDRLSLLDSDIRGLERKLLGCDLNPAGRVLRAEV
jgi:hypothetical protein